MAADHFKIRRHDRSDRQKFMEHNIACAQGGPESVMKFSPQLLESPPPKPPRRRYSDQLSVPSLGTYSSNKKHNEESQRNDSKLKRCSPKPVYLSLPANLTSNILTEHEDSSSHLLSHPLNISGQLKYSRENDFYMKYFLDNLRISENDAKQTYAGNKFCSKEKFQSALQGMNSDHKFSNYHYENFIPCAADKPLKNPLSNSKIFMTNNCINQNFKSFHKECHRRHHSDPSISHFNLQNDNSVKFNWEKYCDNTFSAKKVKKFCDFTGTCSCCKKSYLILQEIRILKEINEKLWHHLCSLQTCLESVRKKVYDECSDVSISGLLSSIYYAQKAKDSALEERLKVVLEERDTALHELEDLIHILTKSFDYEDGEKVDKDMKELLSEMGYALNPSRFLKYQRILLAQIHNFKESKQDCLSHELKQAVIERDNALEKIKKLEEEVKDLKLFYDLWHSDNKQWEFTMFDILNQVIHQRDVILSKIDNGFDICNTVYRPPVGNRLESVEHQNVSLFESRSKTVESLKSHQSLHLSDYKQQHSNGMSDEVTKLKEEILLLNKALEVEKKKREQTEGKCLRLERLIHILRKKLNGQNIGVPV